MNTTTVALMLTIAAMPASAAPAAAQRGTPAEAKAMLAKAATHYKEAGRTRSPPTAPRRGT